MCVQHTPFFGTHKVVVQKYVESRFKNGDGHVYSSNLRVHVAYIWGIAVCDYLYLTHISCHQTDGRKKIDFRNAEKGFLFFCRCFGVRGEGACQLTNLVQQSINLEGQFKML